MQVHVLRVSITACTHHGVKYLTDAGNSFARDLGEDAKEDSEIGFAFPGGASPPGKRHWEGSHGHIPSLPSPYGWGTGKSWLPRPWGTPWDGPFNPRAVSYPGHLGTSLRDQRGCPAMGTWCSRCPSSMPRSPSLSCIPTQCHRGLMSSQTLTAF